MEYIIRNKSLITWKENLEHLYTFKDFPVFLWCTEQKESEDILADMSWSICPETWIIQLDKVLPLEILYQLPHNDGVWKTWEDYYIAFAEYIKSQWVKNILEIWWGWWKVAKNFTKICEDSKYYMVEPNPLIESDNKIEVIRKFFDEKFIFNKKIDAVVHSQVFEHAYNPLEFLWNISNFLKPWQKHILAFPDIEFLLKNKYTSGIHFEHTFMLTDYIAEYFLWQSDFKIIDKYYYKENNNYFYTVEKINNTNNDKIIFTSKYNEYKLIFQDFIKYHEDLIKTFNTKMKEYNGEVYLFWAHIFSQYLFWFWLNKNKISCILDNSDLKNWKRLYWTPFTVAKPDIIRWKNKVAIILKAAIYQEEIRKQLLEINPDIEIWE